MLWILYLVKCILVIYAIKVKLKKKILKNKQTKINIEYNFVCIELSCFLESTKELCTERKMLSCKVRVMVQVWATLRVKAI